MALELTVSSTYPCVKMDLLAVSDDAGPVQILLSTDNGGCTPPAGSNLIGWSW